MDDGVEKRQCWVEKQTNKALDDWRMDDVGLCLGFLAGDESAERGRRTEKGRRRRRRRKRKRREKVPTYNYVNNQSKKTGPCGHVYIMSICFGFSHLHLPPCQPKPPPPFSSVPFKGCSNFHLQIPKRKKEKKERKKKKRKEKKKMYRIVSCRVANARVGYRIKCLSKV